MTITDTTYGAMRVSPRPIETQPEGTGGTNGGHYSIGGKTGLMASGIASAAQVWQVRWASPNKKMIVKRLTVQFSTATGFAATTLGAPVDLFVGHGSTANGSGGSAFAFSTGGKMRTSFASSDFASYGEIRIATTAALTAATGQTLEANPIASCMGADNRTLVSTPPFDLFDQRDAGVHPLILENTDTLAILTNNPAATGTWYMAVRFEWAEAVSY